MTDLAWTGKGRRIACNPWRIAAEKLEAAVNALQAASPTGLDVDEDVLAWQNRLGVAASELQEIAELVHDRICEHNEV